MPLHLEHSRGRVANERTPQPFCKYAATFALVVKGPWPDGNPFRLPPSYRPEIDGLRSLAVLAVIVFHAFPAVLPGGYLGVDIFYVISGYLITSIMLSGPLPSIGSIARFYAGRIRRLVPALAVVLAFAVAAGFVFLLPDEFRRLALHVMGGVFFVDNIIFWKEFSYFEPAAETKPLLHLWSLAVEGQLYLVWPLLIAAGRRLRISLFVPIVVALLASLIFRIWQESFDSAGAFFLAPGRIWEFAAGALLASIRGGEEQRRPLVMQLTEMRPKLVLTELAGLAGIAAILLPTLFLGPNSFSPIPAAVAPVVGAVLLLSIGDRSHVIGLLLSNRAAVVVGLVSYPLYLWHYPLLSLLRIIYNDVPPAVLRLGAIAAAFPLAWLTFRLVEKPVRRMELGPLVSFAASVALLIAGTAWTVVRLDGLKTRTIAMLQQRNLEQFNWDELSAPDCLARFGMDLTFCKIYGAKEAIGFAVFGDSTANALAPGLARLYAGPASGLINIGQWTCPPVRGLRGNGAWGGPNAEYGRNCTGIVDRAYVSLLGLDHLRYILLAMFARDIILWDVPGADNSDLARKLTLYKEMLAKDVAALEQRGITVFITYDNPDLAMDPRNCASVRYRVSKCDGGRLADELRLVTRFEKAFAADSRFKVFRQSALRKGGRLNILDDEGVLLLRDQHHLSYRGSELAALEFARQSAIPPLAFEQALPKQMHPWIDR